MARFLIFISILSLFTSGLALPVDSHLLIDTPSFQSHRERPSIPKSTPSKYESFANNALYYSFNTAKVGAAVGIFCLAITVTERLTRWVYRHVRGSIQYWKDEIMDLKNGGMDSDQIALGKDEFVNEAEGWESPVIEKRSRHIK